jgi:hypothetical protein
MLVCDLPQANSFSQMNVFEQKFPFLSEIVTIKSQHVTLVDRVCRLPYYTTVCRLLGSWRALGDTVPWWLNHYRRTSTSSRKVY